MAYTRQSDTSKSDANVKVLGSGLDAFVSNALASYQNQVKASDAADEASFQALVQKGDMSITDQISYRTAQLSRTPDKDTQQALKSQISALKDQQDQKDFADGYTKQLQDHASGIESVDTVISWLQTQLASAVNTTVKDKINSELVTHEQNRFTLVQNMLKDQTDYALKDKTDSVLTNQITNLLSAKNTAILGGDKTTAANIDLQIQSLNQAKSEAVIVRTMQNFGVASVSGASSAVNLLNSYNNQISSSDTSAPVTVNGQTYSSAQAYWTYTRDSYVADQGSSGLFARLDIEQKTALNVKASDNTLTPSDISATASTFANLMGRPELANFKDQLTAAKQDAMQAGADALGKTVTDKFDSDNDINYAMNTLSSLKALGVNVDSSTKTILNSAYTLKSKNVQDILTAAQQLIGSNSQLSIEDAVNQAVRMGAGTTFSPSDLAANSSSDLVKKALTDASNKTATENPAATVAKPTAATAASAAPATPSSPTGGQSYTIKSGDTLGAIAAQHGVTVSALAQHNNIADPNKIQSGATIQIPGAGSAVQPSSGVSVAAPTAPRSIATQPTQPVATVQHPAAAPAAVAPTSASPTAGAGTYTIKSGDTLGAIAAQHGTTVANLAKINGLADPNKIQAGATLKLS